jgi:hypothetical protein
VLRSINSFDVFDTLIARRSVEPVRVLHQLEARAALPGLTAARQTADQRLGSRGQPYQLSDLWHEVQHVLGLEAVATARLLEWEIQLEHDEVIPIAENLALVQDGDLLVSDTYLPPDVVRSLLRKAGLDKRVAVVVSNDGKYRGWLWPQLLRQVALGQHFGDNPHSDGRTPSAAGLKAVIYTGARRSRVEDFLLEHGYEPLANLVREVRLANPHGESHAAPRHLWQLSCQLNFPLLFLASVLLERYAREGGVREVLFVSRDCLLWHQLYQQLFPHRQSTYLYASRHCLLRPSDSYLNYFRSTWHAGSVIVDLFSTGTSWSKMFARLNSKARCFFIGRVDNYTYLSDSIHPDDWLDITAVFRNSEIGTPLSKGVEMLNYAPHACVEDVVCLPGQVWLPLLVEKLEYDAALPQAAHQSFKGCVQRLVYYPDLMRCPVPDAELIKVLVRWICGDRQLDAIYAGHEAADAAYLQRLLT